MLADLALHTLSPDDIADAIAIDDDAGALYASAGVHFDIAPDHPFALAEYARWTQAARDGLAFLAAPAEGPAVALLVLGSLDGWPYLDQLSVRTSAMRRGIGRWLVRHSIEWAGDEALWLTTYAHVPWNRPFYEREGFEVVPPAACPAGILAILDEQRRYLPAPEQRIAMRRVR
jgi:GNAT superfamily N-acetyltransferase